MTGTRLLDPGTWAGIAAGLAPIALAASYVPARRAAQSDTMAALRAEQDFGRRALRG